VLANLRKATISFVMYVRLSVRMEQLELQWLELKKKLILEVFSKNCRENSSVFKI